MATQLPDGMTVEQAASWFGSRTDASFNPDGPVSQLWLTLGRFPELDAVDEVGASKLFHFADGTVITQSPGSDPTVLASDQAGGLPAGVDAALAARWFGSATNDGTTFAFDLNDPVSKLWLTLGRFPALVWCDDFGDRLYFRFNDGTVIYRSSQDGDFAILGANSDGTPFPDGMDTDLAEIWFGHRFSARGPVSSLWLRQGQRRKQFPTLLGSDQLPNGQFYRFSDGSRFLRRQPTDDPVVFPKQSGGQGAGFAAIWGGGHQRRTQPYGVTEFSKTPKGRGFYAFTLGYCRDWCPPPDNDPPADCDAGHPGIDIGVGFGTELFTPFDGTVVCAGTGGDCHAYACIPSSGEAHSGRFELMLENKDRLVLGHMSKITVRIGDTLRVGDSVGFSGRENGEHVHVEYRVDDPDCRAGNPFFLVDPTSKLGELP